MTIDNLEAIVSPSSEDLLLIRHGGKEWKYPLSTLASNLVNDPTISAATLGTASHPFKTASITTLNVGGSGTVNGNLTVQATTDTTTSALLKVEKTLTVKGDTTVSGTLSTGTMKVTSGTEAANLYVTNLQKDETSESKIPNVYVSTSLTSPTLTASTTTADYLYAENIEGSSSNSVATVKADNLYAENLGKDDSKIGTVTATTLKSTYLTASTTNATTFNPNTLSVTSTASITNTGEAFTSGSLSAGNTTVGGDFSTTSGNLNITNGSATITNEFSANSLKITGASTVGGTATISGNAEAGSLNVTNNLTVATLTGTNGGDLLKVAVSGLLSVKNLTAEAAELTVKSSSLSTTTLTLGTSAALSVTSSLTLQSLKASKSTLTVSSGDIKTSAITASSLSSLELADSGILKLKSLTASSSTLTVDSGNIGTSSITASALSSLTVSDSITAKALSMTGGTLTVGSSGTVTIGSSSNTNVEITSSGVVYLSNTQNFTTTAASSFDTGLSSLDKSLKLKYAALYSLGGIISEQYMYGEKIFNAVWNDLADCIPVNKEAIIEPGYCYCFDGGKYYKSTKYLEKGIIGIESDTYGMHMGSKPGVKQMDVAVSGFALAYVDKEYESGTPLTCTENGYLTEIAKQDKIEYPERIVGTYWKPEPNEEWGSSDRKVKVNGRHWIKIK